MRIVYFILGCIFLALGIAGYFLPLLPGTINLILAAGFFGRSFPRLERWILEHPRLGPPVRDWRKDGSISRKHKMLAISMMWISIIFTCIMAPFWVGFFGVVCISATTWYIATRPTRTAQSTAETFSPENPVDAC